jgi:hypothetical protein
VKGTLIFDCEVYGNYFLLSFLNADTGNVRHFEMFEGHAFDIATVRKILATYRVVSFNGINFDLPLISLALQGVGTVGIKRIADKIILNNAKAWQLNIEPVECDHIDLIEVAPGIASLKIYGGRLHCPKMQDLPIEPDAMIAPEQRDDLRRYCVNDLETTLALFRKLTPQIELREQMGAQYGIDLRSKSDAQIAEAVIRHEVERLRGQRLPKQDPFRLAGETFNYRPPAFIEYRRDVLRDMLDVVRSADFLVATNGTVKMPKEIAELKIAIGGSVYKMGIGGLHSTEKSVAHFADEHTLLIDRDVASYYPAIILNCGLRPAHMGDHFTKVYRRIVQERLAAKRSGNKVEADSKKLTINGSFGKFGSPYSILYSPTLLIQTTVTGQLSLLMLIEMLEDEGIAVVSANTDGIVIKCPRPLAPVMEQVVWEWEQLTGFETEDTHYKALYSRDVNNYVAIKSNGYKLKGVYAPAGLQKNPTCEVVSEAVVAYLKAGTPVEDYIRQCQDVRRFVTIRTVKGGAVKGDEYLGKAVRWYYATGVEGAINYKINGYTVARSEGAKPLMQLPEQFPDDVDLDWYIAETNAILRDIGACA